MAGLLAAGMLTLLGASSCVACGREGVGGSEGRVHACVEEVGVVGEGGWLVRWHGGRVVCVYVGMASAW